MPLVPSLAIDNLQYNSIFAMDWHITVGCEVGGSNGSGGESGTLVVVAERAVGEVIWMSNPMINIYKYIKGQIDQKELPKDDSHVVRESSVQ